ncbi:MAG: hypothetical protein IJ760_03090 [Bacteroidales bacterium]|nr:hypothetical protein [Bacteroidales bacterium]
MNKNEFNQKLTHPDSFTSQDRGWLRAMVARYPHSAAVAVMALLADHAFGFDTPQQNRATALSMCNPAELASMLGAVQQTATEQPPIDILGEINNYQEVSFKTAPKSVILSNFLSIATSDGQHVGDEEPMPAEERDKKSLKADSSLGTETLAVILEKQSKFDKALEIYENLLARNPEKSSIFAPRIERLKQAIANK